METTLTMSVLTKPDTVNFGGNVHGGHRLKLLDQVAYACASRHVNSCFFAMMAVQSAAACGSN